MGGLEGGRGGGGGGGGGLWYEAVSRNDRKAFCRRYLNRSF